jgi:predicted ferric reductase
MPTIIPIPTSENYKPIPESDLKGMAILSTLIFLIIMIYAVYQRIKYKNWNEVELGVIAGAYIFTYLLLFIILFFIYLSQLIGKLL